MHAYMKMFMYVHLGILDQKKGEIKEGGKRNQSEVKPEQHTIKL